MSQPEPLKCTGSLMLQLRDVHLYHIKSYQTNTWSFVEKNTRAVVHWLTWHSVGMIVFSFCRVVRLSVSTARNVRIQMFALFVVQVLHIGDVTTMEHGSRLPPTKHGPITTNVLNSSTITTTAMKRWDTNYILYLHMLFDSLHSTAVIKSQNLCICAISLNCHFSRCYILLRLFK